MIPKRQSTELITQVIDCMRSTKWRNDQLQSENYLRDSLPHVEEY
jgi:hypothetical protein